MLFEEVVDFPLVSDVDVFFGKVFLSHHELNDLQIVHTRAFHHGLVFDYSHKKIA